MLARTNLPTISGCSSIKLLPGEEDAVGVVAGAADEQGAEGAAGFGDEEGLAGDEDLLDVAGVGEEVGDGVGGWGFVDVVEAILADDVAKPGSGRLRGDGVAFEIGEGVDRGILVHHECLRVMLHGGADRNQGHAVRDSLEDFVGRGETEVHVAVGDRRQAAAVGG
jgi:hypothetical protein